MNTSFHGEMERQIWEFQKLGYPDAAGFDSGQWYGGFTSRFYQDTERREHSTSIIAGIDMAPVDFHIPFILVIGESTVSFPKQLHLLNGGLWNGGGTGKPTLFKKPFGLPSRAWLAVDVRVHPWVGGDSDWALYQTLRLSGRKMANLCDVLALGVHFPRELIRHHALGAFGCLDDYSTPYLHAQPYDPNRGLPSGKPNVFDHSVGPNTRNGGGGAIVTVGSYLTVEDVDRNSFERYQEDVERGQSESRVKEVIEE